MRLSLAIDKTRGGIFQIKEAASAGKLGAGIGTAFAVGDEGLLITAKHVVEGYKDKELVIAFGLPPVNYKGVLKINGMFVSMPGAVVKAVDDENDLALIKLPQPLREYKFQTDTRLPEVSPHGLSLEEGEAIEGDAIAVSGYPLSEPSLVTTAGHIASNWTLADHQYERYLGDITVNGGNSGGPVYRLQTGKVVGVAVAYKPAPSHDWQSGEVSKYAHNSGLTLIVPSSAVRELINSAG